MPVKASCFQRARGSRSTRWILQLSEPYAFHAGRRAKPFASLCGRCGVQGCLPRAPPPSTSFQGSCCCGPCGSHAGAVVAWMCWVTIERPAHDPACCTPVGCLWSGPPHVCAGRLVRPSLAMYFSGPSAAAGLRSQPTACPCGMGCTSLLITRWCLLTAWPSVCRSRSARGPAGEGADLPRASPRSSMPPLAGGASFGMMAVPGSAGRRAGSVNAARVASFPGAAPTPSTPSHHLGARLLAFVLRQFVRWEDKSFCEQNGPPGGQPACSSWGHSSRWNASARTLFGLAHLVSRSEPAACAAQARKASRSGSRLFVVFLPRLETYS